MKSSSVQKNAQSPSKGRMKKIKKKKTYFLQFQCKIIGLAVVSEISQQPEKSIKEPAVGRMIHTTADVYRSCWCGHFFQEGWLWLRGGASILLSGLIPLVCMLKCPWARYLLCLNSGSASFEGPGICGLRRRVLQRDFVNHVSRC